MKKVLLLSASFGDGHRQVANALIPEFEKRHVEILTVDSFRTTSRKTARLNEQLYEQLTRYLPSLYGVSYHATAHLALNHWLWKWLARLSRKAAWDAIKEYEPDIVLQLFPDHALQKLPQNIRKKPQIGVILTDYAVHSRWFHSGADFYCFPHAVSAESAKKWILPNQHVRITGIPLRNQFAVSLSGRKNPSSPYVVVATGGRGVFPDLERVLRAIRIGFPSHRVVVLCGRNNQIFNRVSQFRKVDLLVEAVPFTDDMAALYRNAAFSVVKAGGLTVAECHACICPMVFYKPLSGQERINAKVSEKLGTGIVAEDIKEFRQCLHNLSSMYMAEMKIACQDAARPNAAKDVVTEVLNRLR
jgi:processive 1,2-diacylglycerol beta-glucosyltransferase